ncbi:MAG: hypothetical protein ACREBW_02610, partial [Candidatus Micrarchaeaceae archaeon]
FVLLQDPDDLLFRVSALLHPVLPFRLRKNSSFNWSSFPGAGQTRWLNRRVPQRKSAWPK